MRSRADLVAFAAFAAFAALAALAALVASCALALGACGGASRGGVWVAGSDGGDDGASSESFPSGSQGPQGVAVIAGLVACGTSACDTATGVCCVQPAEPFGSGLSSCTALGECPNGGALSCSSAGSCPGSEVCCFSAGVVSPDPVQGGSAVCQKACGAQQTQLCTTSDECPNGKTCQETGGSLPEVCQDAPEAHVANACALSTMATGGVLGVRQCTVPLQATCGGATYQATCACPEGTCACFGPKTTVIHFDGCPSFCPGSNSVGPTNLEHIFDLCGFSQ